MPRVVHFEIHAGDPTRAVNFYQKIFGWTFQKWEGPMDYCQPNHSVCLAGAHRT